MICHIIIIWIILISLLINYNLSKKEPDQSGQLEISTAKEKTVIKTSNGENSTIGMDTEHSDDSAIDTKEEGQNDVRKEKDQSE